MKTYDEKIKAKEEMISKLQKEIDERKLKISKLQSEVKTLRKEKNAEFGKDFILKLEEFGLSETDRKAIFEKIEELALEKEIANSEHSSVSDEPPKTENPTTTVVSSESPFLKKDEKFSQ